MQNITVKDLKNIVILYVEDDNHVRESTGEVFKKLYKKTYIAKNGDEGIGLFKKHLNEIDIVITDLNMPEMNGISMVTEIKKMKSNIPIIVLTGHSDKNYFLSAIDLNIDKYMLKPLKVQETIGKTIDLVFKYRNINKREDLTKKLLSKTKEESEDNSKLTHLLNHTTKSLEYKDTIIDNYVITFKTNVNGILTEASSKFYNFFEYEKDNVIGENVKKLKCNNCVEESFQKIMLKVIYTKKTVTSTHKLITNDGRSIDFEIIMTPFYDDEGLVEGYVFYLEVI